MSLDPNRPDPATPDARIAQRLTDAERRLAALEARRLPAAAPRFPAGRTSGVDYQPDLERPTLVVAWAGADSGPTRGVDLVVSPTAGGGGTAQSSIFHTFAAPGGQIQATLVAVVPAGWYYRFTYLGSVLTIGYVVEQQL